MKFEKEAHYEPSMNRTVSWNVVLMFLVLVFGFTVATVLKPQDERSEAENRPLQQRPSLTWDSLISGEFAEDYEAYLSDQFVGRNGWITLRTDFERATGKQETSGVYFAKDGYLIESHEGIFTAKQADANINLLAAWAGGMAETYGPEHFTVMLVPNAVDILRDKLPAFADPYDEEVYLARAKSAVEAAVEAADAAGAGDGEGGAAAGGTADAGDGEGGAAAGETADAGYQDGAAAEPADVWFDAASVLREHKDEEIFYRTDHHWKTLGAYYVYEEWARSRGLSVGAYVPTSVTESFEGTISSKLGIKGRADSIERYDPEVAKDYYLVYNQSDDVRNSIYQDSFLGTKDKYSYFYGGNTGLIQTVLPKSQTEVSESQTGASGNQTGASGDQTGASGHQTGASGNQTGRKLLIIKDSYAHCFAPFTYENFDEVDLVDLRYYNSSLSELIAQGGYTDILFLQNAAGFAEETSLAKLAT